VGDLMSELPASINERNFRLVEYKDKKGEMRPMIEFSTAIRRRTERQFCRTVTTRRRRGRGDLSAFRANSHIASDDIGAAPCRTALVVVGSGAMRYGPIPRIGEMAEVGSGARPG
jgi:hypothetical protein